MFVEKTEPVEKTTTRLPVAECVSFLLIKEGSCLLERRSATKASEPNIIAIPGGHIEAGENQAQALQREVQEELGVDATRSVYLCSLYHPTEFELQLLHYYVVDQWQGEIACHEADEVFWTPIAPSAVETVADKIAIQEFQRLYPRYLAL
ncbi:NUDIX domain-containing protein [Vibrio cholerae]|nr:NUDIX domain-containing protein [Vibrio cholerae]